MQLRFAEKYCSKVAALTTWDTADEPVRCDTCIHWNGGPCSKWHRLLMKDKGKIMNAICPVCNG